MAGLICKMYVLSVDMLLKLPLFRVVAMIAILEALWKLPKKILEGVFFKYSSTFLA